ncbi:MAG: ribosome biogenesis factor YjgA [Casimicrobiaceae bacterium]
MPRPNELPDIEPDSAPSSADSPAALSKTQRKHAMHALQELGKSLVALDARHLRELPLPERLSDAIVQARGIRAHEGRRRQMQYIGKLMRDVDIVPIEAALERWATGPTAENAQFAMIECWRDRLVREGEALAEFTAAYPHADYQRLATLIHDARAERARSGPPHRYRELFRYVKTAVASVDSVE